MKISIIFIYTYINIFYIKNEYNPEWLIQMDRIQIEKFIPICI